MEPKARDVRWTFTRHDDRLVSRRERSVETIAVENVAPEIVKSEDLRS
jgi:hypothetical protein